MFLSISQKAVTEADALLILEQACNLTRPFGIPTIVINPENLYLSESLTQEWTRKKNTAFVYGSDHRPLSDIFSEALKKCPELSQEDVIGIQNTLRIIKTASNALNDVVVGEYSAYAHPMKNMQCTEFADNYTESTYISPAFNTIFIPRKGFSAYDWLARALNTTKGELPDYLPGYDSQYNFMILAHEIGHGTGAGEAQTEMMAAIVSRQAFADTRFISAQADIRALSLIYSRDGCLQQQGYHWSMVEGIDHVIAMDQSTIDAMTEDDIKTLRFKKFPHVDEQWESLNIIFGIASAHGGKDFINAYNNRDLLAIAQTIRNMPTTHLSNDAKIIAARLALAAERLGTPGAYSEKSQGNKPMKNAFLKNLFNMLCGKSSASDLAHCAKLIEITGLDWTPVYGMGPDTIFRTNDQAPEDTIFWRMKILNAHLFMGQNVFKNRVVLTDAGTSTWRNAGHLRESDHYLFITKRDFLNCALASTLLPTPKPGQTLRTYTP